MIGGSLFVISAFIAASVTDSNPFAILGGLIVLPFCVLLAIQQYRGTFRRVPSAAMTASVLLYIFGGFSLFGGVTTAGEAVMVGDSLWLMFSFLIPMLAVATVAIAFGRMNARWCGKLRAAVAAGDAPANPRGFSLRELLLVVGVIAAMTTLTSQFIRTAPPRYAEHVEPSASPFSLPEGATDVSYCRGHRGTIAFEFTIDEAGFRGWVNAGIGSIESESANIPVREITSPFIINCYHALSPELNGPKEIAIANGLYYSWFKEDRGVYAAYDRDIGRAYYFAQFH
jgi:hypothetical protein